MEINCWEVTFRTFTDATARCAKGMDQGFAIILGQFAPTIVDRIKCNALYNEISANDEVIGLLRLICTSRYTGATSKK
jgi:hypothetical protein